MQGGAAAGPAGPVEDYKTGRVVFIACVGALGGFLFGYDSAVINGANSAIQSTFGISEGALGIVVAIALLGSAVGAWFGGALANKFGRKKVAITAAILFLIAGFGQGLPFSVYDLMFWRILGGFAIGVASVASPMYISEISPAHLRGKLTSLFQFAIVIGIFATGLMNYVILEAAGGEATNELALGLEAWQWMFLLMVIPAGLYGGLTLIIPESPRYLVQVGKLDEARHVIARVLGGDVEAKIADIQASEAGEEKPSMKDLKGPKFGLLGIVWVGILLSVFQQFVGINAVIYYSNLIYESVGFSESDSFLTSMITTAVNVTFTIVAIIFVDRLGRKPLLLIGSTGMAVCLATIAVIFATAPKCTQAVIDNAPNALCNVPKDLKAPMLGSASGLIAVIALNVFIAFFASTWGPVVWVLISEMFPNRIRAAGLAIAAAAQWVGNFVVSSTFPGLAHFSLGVAYGLFTFFALLSIWFVIKFVKETKGVELEDMGKLEGVPAGA